MSALLDARKAPRKVIVTPMEPPSIEARPTRAEDVAKANAKASPTPFRSNEEPSPPQAPSTPSPPASNASQPKLTTAEILLARRRKK